MPSHKTKAAPALNTERGHLFPGFQARYFRRAGTGSLYQNGILHASLSKKGKNGFFNIYELFRRQTSIVIFSIIFNCLVKTIQSLEAHAVKQIALRPHNSFLPVWRQWFFKIQTAMPWHGGIRVSGAERDYCAKTAYFAKSGGDNYYWPRFYDLRSDESGKITNQNSAWIGMKVNSHKLPVTNIRKIYNEFSYA